MDRLGGRGRYWQRLVDRWTRSDLTQTAFCHQRGVNLGTFHWWKRQLARRDGLRDAKPVADARPRRRVVEPLETIFAPVRIRTDEPIGVAGRIEIVLVGGRRLRLRGHVDRQALMEVLAVLEATAC